MNKIEQLEILRKEQVRLADKQIELEGSICVIKKLMQENLKGIQSLCDHVFVQTVFDSVKQCKLCDLVRLVSTPVIATLDEPVMTFEPVKPCPDCGGAMSPLHRDGDMLAPEADWWECQDCGYETDPE